MKNDMRYGSSLLKFFLFSNDFPLEHTLTDWLIVLSIKYYALTFLTIIAHIWHLWEQNNFKFIIRPDLDILNVFAFFFKESVIFF